MTYAWRLGPARICALALGSFLNASFCADLSISPAVVQVTHCHGVGRASDQLRVDVTLSYTNVSTSVLLLPRFAIVSDIEIAQHCHTKRERWIPVLNANRRASKPLIDSRAFTLRGPDLKLFEILTPGAVTTRKERLVLSPDLGPAGISLLGSNTTVRLGIACWPGADAYVNELARAWSGFGRLQRSRIKTELLTFLVPDSGAHDTCIGPPDLIKNRAKRRMIVGR